MPPTPDLATRVLAAIDETAKVAWVADDRGGLPPTTWIGVPSRSGKWQILREADDSTPIGYISDGRWEIRHITRHDPAAVLRRCNADRALIAYAQSWQHRSCEDSRYACPQAVLPGCVDPCDCGVDEHRETVLRGLAAGYGLLVADELPEAVS